MAHNPLLEMSFRGTMVIPVLHVCYSQTGKFCYSQCWYFEAVVTCFITGIQSEGDKTFKVDFFYFFWGGCLEHFFFFFLLLWVFCFRVERFLRWLCVASAVPLKLAKNVFLTDASSYLPRTVVGFKPRGGGSPPTRPPETYAPCPLALRYDRAQTHEREVITNGRQGQGSYLSQNGFFSTAVHRRLHEHMTNNHYIELRYEVVS